MAFQIIFAVESNEKSRSDYMYIRSVLDNYYHALTRKDIKISSVFMRGKGNYCKTRVKNEIMAYTKNYSINGATYIIYCFDTDKYESNPEAKALLKAEEHFCKENGYDFVWFCHDIEEVFQGHSVKTSEKTDLAKKYFTNAKEESIPVYNLKNDAFGKRKSNLINVLDKYLKG